MTNPIAVSQRAREAAADAMSHVWANGSSHSDFVRILDGRLDHHWPAQAFARFEAEIRAAEVERLREALAWYGEQARLARLIHSEGDAGRHALADDGGKRARQALDASR